jgi:hypothetical protein
MIPEIPTLSNEGRDETLQRLGNGDFGDYHEWRLLVSDALRDAGYDDDADEFWSCAGDDAVFWTTNPPQIGSDSNAASVYVCPAHGVKIIRKTCHLRICPDCARRAANRLLARFMPTIQETVHSHHPRYRFRKIVLTTPFCLTDPDAKAQYRRLKKCLLKVFDELLPKDWRSDQGYIVADEWGADGLKLHFHILFYGQWLDNRKANGYPLATAWRKVTGGDCEVVYIAGVSAERVEAEVVETLKYCVKFWKSDPETGDTKRLSPDSMVILHQVLKGERRVRSSGIFYRLNAVADRAPCCPVCSEELKRMTISEYNIWVITGWTPEEQTLYLRTGNKSPPPDLPGGKERPETDQQTSATLEQPTLSPDFLPSTPYQNNARA